MGKVHINNHSRSLQPPSGQGDAVPQIYQVSCYFEHQHDLVDVLRWDALRYAIHQEATHPVISIIYSNKVPSLVELIGAG